MRDYFETLCTELNTLITGKESWLAWLDSENTGFCRFNHGKMRQQGTVKQAELTLTLANGQKHSRHSLMLSQVLSVDKAHLKSAINALRSRLGALPDDPFFLVNKTPVNSELTINNQLTGTREISHDITKFCEHDDFVGILISGKQCSAFASSYGQRNWFEAEDFNLDYSLYLHTDKAIKDRLAGNQWQADVFTRRIEKQRSHLAALGQKSVNLKPGDYRVYLTPSALRELLQLMSFSARRVHDKSSPLRRLHDQEVQLNPMVNITMDLSTGQTPPFQGEGFVMPDKLALLEGGISKQLMTSPRTELEYGVQHNGSPTSESPSSLIFHSGQLPQAESLQTLDNGILISNLWYLNYSDPNSARITGMTRFACFLVENGKIKAPINALRFDDSLYQMLGDNLEALTCEKESLMSTNTWLKRHRGVLSLPGALLSSMRFTL